MLYIFDVDGTLADSVGAKSKSGETFAKSIYYNRTRKVRRLSKTDQVAIATNQAGVSLGLITLGDVILRVSALSVLVGASEYAISLWHPSVTYDKHMVSALEHPLRGFSINPLWRKPQPGMLDHLRLMLGYGAEDTVYIGDRLEDNLAAQAAQIKFVDHAEFFADVDDRQSRG